jgi:hypothetical protein
MIAAPAQIPSSRRDENILKPAAYRQPQKGAPSGGGQLSSEAASKERDGAGIGFVREGGGLGLARRADRGSEAQLGLGSKDSKSGGDSGRRRSFGEPVML